MATRVMSREAPGLTRREWKTLVRVATWVVLVLLLVAGLQWVLGAERRAVKGMEPAKRAVLFQESFESFETLCREDPGGALTSSCRRQARFLRQFPECGGACRSRLSPYLSTWTR
jgi:cytochrome b pre-mRNA-processing protein 3